MSSYGFQYGRIGFERGQGYDDEAALAISGEDLLSRDNIPDNNQSLTCLSCGTKYVGVFCHNCGQKNDDMRRSLFSLIVDMLGNLTAIDSRIWRSWIKLLTRPGQVAREYADGARTKWTSPVRAYLAMSILLFGYIAVTGTQIFSVSMDELRASSDTELVNFILNYPAPLTVELENSRLKFAEMDMSTDKKSKRYFELNGKRLSPEEASYRGVATLKLLLTRPQILNNYFSDYLPRIMILMMPFTMFLGYIFIRRRGNALLYDHLVHAAYIHAVFFFLFLIGVILGRHTPVPTGALMGTLTLYMLLYLPMSLKYMFKRGVIKTIWSSYAIGFIYFLTIFFILLFVTVYGFTKVIQQTDILIPLK